MYAAVINNEIVKTWAEKPLGFGHAGFREDTTDEELAAFGIFPVTETKPETFDQYHSYVRNEPVLVDSLPVVTWTVTELDLANIKRIKRAELETTWATAVQNGSFMSANADMRVDCRRNDKDNDIQNIDGILGLLAASVITEPVSWKGVTAVASLTTAQLQGLKIEMFGYGAAVYQRKFTALAAVEAATTLAEVAEVVF
jgi:hypothetical protein